MQLHLLQVIMLPLCKCTVPPGELGCDAVVLLPGNGCHLGNPASKCPQHNVKHDQY